MKSIFDLSDNNTDGEAVVSSNVKELPNYISADTTTSLDIANSSINTVNNLIQQMTTFAIPQDSPIMTNANNQNSSNLDSHYLQLVKA